jgi:hypothetical protein
MTYHSGRYEHSSRRRNIRRVTHMVEWRERGSLIRRISNSAFEAQAFAGHVRDSPNCTDVRVLEDVPGSGWVER